MKPNVSAAQLGLPLRTGPVRFAVGPPDGLTSNAWRVWTEKQGDIYVACRDNFKTAKVSLHASGRWRMGFTTEAVKKGALPISPNENRAWEVWDKPPGKLPGAVAAFRLIFPTSELAVRPEQRLPDKWKNVLYIEEGPPGKLTVVTLFVTQGDPELKHATERSFRLASLDIGKGLRAQLVAHAEPEKDVPGAIERSVAAARVQAEAAGVVIPAGAHAYLFGKQDDGARFLIGARMDGAPRRSGEGGQAV